MELEIIGLFALSALAVIAHFLLLLSRVLNNAAFAAQIRKLVDSGNTERAIKLCRAVPRASMSRMTEAMLRASGQEFAVEGLREAYSTTWAAERERLSQGWWLPYAAMASAAACLSYSLKGDAGLAEPFPLLAIGCLVAAFLQLWSYGRHRRALEREAEGLLQYLVTRAQG